MELSSGILSTSSIAPQFIAAVRQGGKGQIAALSSKTLEKHGEGQRVGTSRFLRLSRSAFAKRNRRPNLILIVSKSVCGFGKYYIS